MPRKIIRRPIENGQLLHDVDCEIRTVSDAGDRKEWSDPKHTNEGGLGTNNSLGFRAVICGYCPQHRGQRPRRPWQNQTNNED